MKRLFLVPALLVLLGVSPVQAGFVVGTEPEGNGGYGVGFSFASDVNLIIAQQFSLNSAIVADSITLYLNGDGTNDPQGEFTLQVMNQIGAGATNANVLLTTNGTFPGGVLPTGHAAVTLGGLNLALGAGTYYLVVSSAAGPGTGWGAGATEIPSALGTVGASYVGIAIGGAVADYTLFDAPNTSFANANFRIDSASPVPEPTSLIMLLGGSIAVASVRRKRD